MTRAFVDTSVLFAAVYNRDQAHDTGLRIVTGFDDGSLPGAVVLDYVLAETINGLTAHAGHDAAVDFLDRIETNARFHVERLPQDGFATAKAIFRRHERLSLVDACLVASMRRADLQYLYAFDTDFDGLEDVIRLDTPTNPFDPDGNA